MNTFSIKKYKIVFSDIVISIFNKHKQTLRHDCESGGIVLGQVIGNTVFINRVSTPNLFDKSSRHRFERDKNAAQIIVNYEYLNSNKKITYLGEWHSHPENIPTPSGQDRKMIREQFNSGILNESFLLLVIQGIEKLYVAIYDGENLTECSELNDWCIASTHE
jgi:integrative and conjugative element protein (TIGR02256 family)